MNEYNFFFYKKKSTGWIAATQRLDVMHKNYKNEYKLN